MLRSSSSLRDKMPNITAIRQRTPHVRSVHWVDFEHADTRHDCNQGRRGRVDWWLSMRSCALSTAHAAGARVPLPLPDVPEGIRSAVHGVRECQARRPALDAREPVDLRELERRRAELLKCLRHSSDISPGRERQHRRDNRQPGRPGSCAPDRAVWHRERAILDQWAQSASCQAYRRLEA